MSKATLTSLLEFLYGTLSSEDKRWIGEQLIEQANEEEMKPYTIEELHERIAKAERDFADGRYFTDDEVFADLDEYEKKEELQCAEAV